MKCQEYGLFSYLLTPVQNHFKVIIIKRPIKIKQMYFILIILHLVDFCLKNSTCLHEITQIFLIWNKQTVVYKHFFKHFVLFTYKYIESVIIFASICIFLKFVNKETCTSFVLEYRGTLDSYTPGTFLNIDQSYWYILHYII